MLRNTQQMSLNVISIRNAFERQIYRGMGMVVYIDVHIYALDQSSWQLPRYSAQELDCNGDPY